MARGNVSRVTGNKELQKALDMIGDNLGKDLKPIHLRAAQIVLPVAQALAPRVTGELAGSLEASATTRTARIRSGLPYAAPIHWGWPSRHIEARTFVVDAARVTEGAWLQVYTDGVQQIIDRAVVASGADNPRDTT